MSARPRSLEQHREVLAALDAADGIIADAAKHLGVSRETARDRVYAARRALALIGEIAGPPIPDIAKPPEGFVIRRNSGEYDEDGNLRRQWIETKPGTTDGYQIPEGHVVKGESALLDSHGNVLNKWIKTREENASEGLVEGLRAAFAEYDGKAGEVPVFAAPFSDDLLTVYPLPDLHFGMYAWGRETGASYDIGIAAEIALNTVKELVNQSFYSKHAVILGLGDYFHTNDAKNATPRSGNLLDVDGRWPKVYAAGAELAMSIVDIAARKHQEVEVAFLPGNHDPDAAVTLAVALGLFYRLTPRIQVCQEPGYAWYRRFGSTLLGATHGHTMKPDRMAMMLATDRAQDWGQSKHYHVFFGHIHHETVMEIGPVRCESFQSPAARDGYNAGAGYRSGRSLSAITFHREKGEIGRHRVNIG